jgi:hypothetical protein
MSKSNLHPPHDAVKRFQAAYDAIVSLHRRFYDYMAEMDRVLKSKTLDKQDLCDIGFLFRQCRDQLDDWRKDAQARMEFVNNSLGETMTQEIASRPDKASDKVEGTLANGTLDVIHRGAPPAVGTPEFEAFGKWAGISDTKQFTAGLMKISWTEMEKLLTTCMEEGLPLPPNMKTWPVFNVKYRKKSSRATDDVK